MKTKGEKTKQRILETASVMFWKSSYHNVRIDKIVAQANVNKASFYQYFKNKEQAAFECVVSMSQRSIDYLFKGSFDAHQHPIRRLEEIFNRMYRVHQRLKDTEGSCPGCPYVNMGNEMATDSELIRAQVETVFQRFAAYHQQIYLDAKAQGLTNANWPPEMIGRQLQNILNGAMTSSKINNQPQDILDALAIAKSVLGVLDTQMNEQH